MAGAGICADATKPHPLLKAGQWQEQNFSPDGACYGKFTLQSRGRVWMPFPAAAPPSCLPRKQTHSWKECCSLVSRGERMGKIAIKKCNVLLLVSECDFPACWSWPSLVLFCCCMIWSFIKSHTLWVVILTTMEDAHLNHFLLEYFGVCHSLAYRKCWMRFHLFE